MSTTLITPEDLKSLGVLTKEDLKDIVTISKTPFFQSKKKKSVSKSTTDSTSDNLKNMRTIVASVDKTFSHVLAEENMEERKKKLASIVQTLRTDAGNLNAKTEWDYPIVLKISKSAMMMLSTLEKPVKAEAKPRDETSETPDMPSD